MLEDIASCDRESRDLTSRRARFCSLHHPYSSPGTGGSSCLGAKSSGQSAFCGRLCPGCGGCFSGGTTVSGHSILRLPPPAGAPSDRPGPAGQGRAGPGRAGQGGGKALGETAGGFALLGDNYGSQSARPPAQRRRINCRAWRAHSEAGGAGGAAPAGTGYRSAPGWLRVTPG